MVILFECPIDMCFCLTDFPWQGSISPLDLSDSDSAPPRRLQLVESSMQHLDAHEQELLKQELELPADLWIPKLRMNGEAPWSIAMVLVLGIGHQFIWDFYIYIHIYISFLYTNGVWIIILYHIFICNHVSTTLATMLATPPAWSP